MKNVLRISLVLMCLVSSNLVTTANAGQLVADLSKSNVSITSGFHGTDLLLFGAVEGHYGDDILVVVTGPPTDIAQHRKGKKAGIWMNVETNIWQQVPSLYTILATRRIENIVSPATLSRLGIGAENMRLKINARNPERGKTTPSAGDFIDALRTNMTQLGLWSRNTSKVTLTKNALFRAEVHLPANILPGNYDVRVLHLRDGIVISQDTTNLSIEKGGLSAIIYNFANDYSALYGIFAIVFAAASGWLAATAFRRG